VSGLCPCSCTRAGPDTEAPALRSIGGLLDFFAATPPCQTAPVDGEARDGWVRAHWIGVIAAVVLLHGSLSLVRGVHLDPHHRTSPWLVVAVVLSVVGGFALAFRPARLLPQTKAHEVAFYVLAAGCLLYDVFAARSQGGILIRNGATALAWLAGVGMAVARDAVSRRRAPRGRHFATAR